MEARDQRSCERNADRVVNEGDAPGVDGVAELLVGLEVGSQLGDRGKAHLDVLCSA